MKTSPRGLTVRICLLVAGLTIASFIAGTPAPADTIAYFEAAYPSSIFIPVAPDGRRSIWFPEAYAGLRYVDLENRSPGRREPPAKKSYLIPAFEIFAFTAAMNGIDRLAYPDETTSEGKKTYNTSFSTFWNNLAHGHWMVDTDDFMTNQFQHPYQGATYQAFARSAGLDFWESMGYTFLGSLLWETAGETSRPSVNDQVANGIAGNFLGEPFFRMANLLVENSRPGFWRELGAALISPPTSFNRHVFGERFDAVFPSHKPAVFWQMDLGANLNTHHSGPDTGLRQDGAMAGFSLEYGLPGKPGYHYTRPFDYFLFEASIATDYSNTLGTLNTRGLLFGREYTIGDFYKGIWGLYGTYDYTATDPARVSTTAVSLGTTAQWWLSPRTALQGTALGGVGYGAGGEISGFPERSYRYGGTAQGVLDLRLIFDDIAMLDFRGRQFYISDVAATSPEGSESIRRLGLGLTVRIHDRHAIGLRYQLSTRDTHFRGIENRSQEVGMVSLVYTFLSAEGLGAVDFSNFPGW